MKYLSYTHVEVSLSYTHVEVSCYQSLKLCYATASYCHDDLFIININILLFYQLYLYQINQFTKGVCVYML